jgi:hypothetical protein
MNNLTYKDWFNTDQKIKLQEELSASINSNWDVFFTTQYQSYVTSSLSSSLKVFKSFSDENIITQNNFILTKSIYDEYIYDLYGKNVINNLYTSSIQKNSFDYITNVYFNVDQYDPLSLINQAENFDEYRLLDILYGNSNGSGSSDGNLITYDNASKGYDLSYPTKAVYNEIKQISTATEEPIPSKIKISGSVDNVFALNFSSNHLYDGIAKKSFELILCKMNGSSSINEFNRQLNIQYLGTNGETDPDLIRDGFYEREIYSFIELARPSENSLNTLKSNFIVSGTLENGMYLKNNSPVIYGKIYYDQGLVILDAQKLNGLLNLNLQTGSNVNSNNSLRLFKSIQSALGLFTIITDGNLDVGNPYFPAIQNTILNNVGNQISTPKLNIKQEINSTFYRCILNLNEFNYSSNPSFYDEKDGSMNVKKFYSGSSDFYVRPETFITSIGLYDSLYNLLAVAKLSKPQRKSFDNTLIINVRLDY